MTARPPTIRRQKVTVNGQSGRVDPVGVAEVDLIEPREHAAWMQQVADILAGYDPETITAVAELLSAHKADFSNPHRVTAEQIGADPTGAATALVNAEAAARAAGDAAVTSSASTALGIHAADTSTHGVTEVVGTTETQTLTNKTILVPYATTAVGLTLSTQNIIKVTAACTIVVPTAVGVAGRIYTIDNAHAGTTTVNPTGAETIEGETTQALIGNCCMVIYSDGANWRIS